MTPLQDPWNSSATTNELPAYTEESVDSHPLYKTSRYIWFFGPPIILLLGNFGNIMTIIIMHRQRSEEAVINLYFTALAVLDLISLDVYLLGDWVGITFGYFIHHHYNVLCKIHSWSIGCSTIGGWFLVCLTTQRALSVVWPHRVNSLCTRRLVTGLILGMTATIALIYSHYLYGFHLRYFEDTGEFMCTIVLGPYQQFVYEVFTYIDLVLYSVLPFTCIFAANSVLVWKLRATIREIRHKVAEKESFAAREKAASSVTLTIILVSVAYVVLTLPVAVYFISLYIYDPSAVMSVEDRAVSELTRAVTFMMMFANSAVNFYLYCLTGAKFRKEFLGIFCPRG
ncbi:type-1 angiotensin II receptor A-like [Babylonia areolata]|uniref:type-1 angiotensin II receptor A-like n=1 Tax=Babylonia areolata TaxID=304850 RepID=UPI003FD5C3D8